MFAAERRRDSGGGGGTRRAVVGMQVLRTGSSLNGGEGEHGQVAHRQGFHAALAGTSLAAGLRDRRLSKAAAIAGIERPTAAHARQRSAAGRIALWAELQRQRRRRLQQLADPRRGTAPRRRRRGCGGRRPASASCIVRGPRPRRSRRRPRRCSSAPTDMIAACGGLMIAVKLRDPEHAEVRDGERAAASSGGVIVPSRTRSASARVSRAISPSALASASNTVGHDQRVLGRDRHAHVHARVQQQRARRGSCRWRVGCSRSAERARLDDHVVVGRARPRRPRCASASAAARRRTHSSMSTSIWTLKSGIVAFDSAIRRATVCWSFVSSTSVVSPFAVATASSAAARVAGSGVPGGAPWIRRAGALDVGLHDPPARARARDRGEVDAALAARSAAPAARPSRAAAAPSRRCPPAAGAAAPPAPATAGAAEATAASPASAVALPPRDPSLLSATCIARRARSARRPGASRPRLRSA